MSEKPHTPSESQTGHTPESGREHDAGTTVTNADTAYFLLDACNAAQPGEEKRDDEEPECFQDAWNHPDPAQRKKWCAAIKKEFHDMIKRKVWRVICKRDIPPDRRCVKSKWVLRLSATMCTVHAWLLVDTPRYREYIFLRIVLLL